MHRAFQGSPKGAPSCAWAPYPLHESVSHSWLCDAVVDAAVELVADAVRVQCDRNAELNAALTRVSGPRDVPPGPSGPSEPGRGATPGIDQPPPPDRLATDGQAYGEAARLRETSVSGGGDGGQPTFQDLVSRVGPLRSTALASAESPPTETRGGKLSDRMRGDTQVYWPSQITDEVAALEDRLAVAERNADEWRKNAILMQDKRDVAERERDEARAKLAEMSNQGGVR